jgi:aryl-alcohol dehydrogenase-like predicted oxidoreductase
MQYRQLGSSGLVVSAVGLGCNNFGLRIDEEASRQVVVAALDAGVTFFDTADTYGSPKGASEELLGRALRGRRDDAVIATKFGGDMVGALGPDWNRRNSRRYIRIAVEASLRRLGTEWIDLYQLHWRDGGTPVEEILSTLDDLVREGKVRYIGCCNLSGWQVAESVHTARERGLTPYASAQNHYSLLTRRAEEELIPAAEHYGVGVLPYFPLENGLLTGKYRRAAQPPEGSRLADPRFQRYQKVDDAPWDVLEALEAFAQERGHTLLELAFAGLVSRPAIASIIAGATSAEQVRANAAAGSWALTAEDVAEVDRITGKG